MSVKHIGDLKKDECYGCTACQFTCPFGAISMQNDHEGFRYPVVDEENVQDVENAEEYVQAYMIKTEAISHHQNLM